MANNFRAGTTPLGLPDVVNYVNRIGANLAAHMQGGWTYRFEIIRDEPDTATHEPTAFPGGPIFVSAELLAAAQNEGEFAGLLAHAMAHVAERHWTRQATKANMMQIASLPMGGTGTPANELPFQRANERQADYLAVQTMADAGFDPVGLVYYIDRMQPPASASGRVFDKCRTGTNG